MKNTIHFDIFEKIFKFSRVMSKKSEKKRFSTTLLYEVFRLGFTVVIYTLLGQLRPTSAHYATHSKLWSKNPEQH